MSNTNQVTYNEAQELGKQHHLSGNLGVAERIYKDILKVLPNDFNSLHFLSIIMYQQGDIKSGIDFVERALKEKDDHPESWNAYAIMVAEMGNKADAIQYWQNAIKHKPDYAEAYSNMGNAYWELDDFEKAEEYAQKAIDLKPQNPGAYINLGNAYASRGEHERAIETWQKAIDLDQNNLNAYINIANALKELGRLQESEEHCKKALELSPNHPKALLNLGNVKKEFGNFEEAEQIYRQITEIVPNYVAAHYNLSLALIDQQKFTQAISSLKYVLAFEPNHVEGLTNLAVALAQTNQLEEAEKTARKALSLQPESSEARIDLADILFKLDRYDEAKLLLDEVLEISPDNARIHVKLSNVLERMNDIDGAIEQIDKAVLMSPESAEIHQRKASIYFMSGRIEEANKSLNQALELKPDFPSALGTQSEILQSQGKMAEAEKSARQGIDLNPDIPYLYFTLSKVHKFSENDPELAKMIELSTKDISMPEQIAPLNFALFKAHEDVKDYKKSFHYLKTGNDKKFEAVYFDREAQNIGFQKIHKTWTKGYIQKFDDKGIDDNTPIFIIGMPRSGTTLTEQIISSHPDVFGAGELPYLSTIEKKAGLFSPQNAENFAKAYIKKARSINEESQKAKHITDKMPGNYAKLGHILTSMPNAKVIHCKRNPIDTCLSCYKQLFARGHYWSYNLNEMADHYALYMDLMAHWRALFPDQFLEINYEDTVEDFENQARKLIDYVELEWDDACLTPHKSKRTIMTASKGQVRKPIYKTSVEAWRRYEDELAPLVEKLEPFIGDNRRQKVD